MPTIAMTLKQGLKYIMVAAGAAMTLCACSEYQVILKTHDNELWYRKGLEYYAKGDYVRSANLLGGVVNVYGGSMRADTIVRTYANALMEIGDYYTAAHYFNNYVKTFPSSEHCEDCQYKSGYCFYMTSPKPLLDQVDTEKSIEEFQQFINLYPESSLVPQAEQMMKEMQDKLAYKSYLNAKLYYDLGDYMGNNYLSAVITAQNCLRRFPDTKYREELSFLILQSKFEQAERSILMKQSERYRETIDEYYAFINDFPSSRYSKDAVRILEGSEKGLKNAEKLLPPSEDDMDYYRNFGRRADAEKKQVNEEE